MPYDPSEWLTATYSDSSSQTSKKDNFYFPYYFSDINAAHNIPRHSIVSCTITVTMNRTKTGTAIGQLHFGAASGTSMVYTSHLRTGIDWDQNPPYTLIIDGVGFDDDGNTYKYIETDGENAGDFRYSGADCLLAHSQHTYILGNHTFESSIKIDWQYQPPYILVQIVGDQTMGNTGIVGQFNCGEQYTIKAKPKNGYRFVKWSDGNINSERTITAPSLNEISAHTTIVDYEAIYEPEEYTVTINTNHPLSNTNVSIKVSYGSTYNSLNNISYPRIEEVGYILKGYFTSASGGDQITPDTICTLTENHNLYAQWEINEILNSLISSNNLLSKNSHNKSVVIYSLA